MGRSCSDVRIYEDDGGAKTAYTSDPAMADDYVNDVNKIKLSMGNTAELLDVEKKSAKEGTQKDDSFTLSKAAREKRDKPSGCWTCWPAPKKESKGDKVELLGISSDKPGKDEAKKNTHPTYAWRGKETEPPNECGKYEEDKKKRQYGIRVDQGVLLRPCIDSLLICLHL